ncbi:CLUMA_CG015208, isoform A [Clunio marinus]|uniref:ATP-binding cassette sub-family B member 6 n=1 Tax=Clunio marinus TaxID=568069 RepID=A0A1J1ITU1_9DIPT|nr:CLUMA_CG015208, isoform A [Clunio marinus]
MEEKMPAFCPGNITLHDIWINHGVSQCVMDTISSSIIGGFILFFGFVQIIVYQKYSTRIDSLRLRPSFLYKFQILLMILMPILTSVRFYLRWKIYIEEIYGYMIMYTVLTIFSYLFATCLIWKERHYQLPSVPSRGHGIVLLTFFTFIFVAQNLALVNINSNDWWFNMQTKQDRIEMTFFVTRYICTLFIFVLGLRAPGISSIANENEETLMEEQEQNDENRSTFRNGWKKLKTLMPFLWPKKDCLLQLRVLLCFFLLLIGRVINLFVPLYNKKIVDSLAVPNEFRWGLILTYVGFKFLQGGGTGSMGFLNNARSFMWIRIQQYTTRTIEVELFRHLHSLSLRWHLGRKTGEVLRVMDRGTDSINNLLNYILFSIIPTLIDILIAVVFFITAFNWMFGLIVFVTMILYIFLTIAITEWRTKFQRRMNLADNETRARSVDSLLNFETVKYYGAEGYEVDAYQQAILNYQKEEFSSIFTLNILNTAQNIIVCSGLLGGSLLCAWMVAFGKGAEKLTIGDYVLFSTYIIQLYVPLNWFGTYYRQIQKNFVDMENMFDLMKEEQEVIDAPGAPGLSVVRGGIDFSNVSFGYSPEKIILKNVTFNIAPGKTVALVGQSGAGKSTIMRLLFRFYDVNSGAIMIDGQNIKTVTQASLRRAIGVVPQDTVLFNQTIKYNIKYGRISADDQEVIAAARNADIHEKILAFPQQYETQVGERGLRLSGGEKQRVAIARTILKGPQIVLLDEATSALDTQTERNIQAALARVCANKTTLIIAHRLSTIIHADEILVLREGEIIERGRHEQLLQEQGLYMEMWNQQLKNMEGEKLRDEKDFQELNGEKAEQVKSKHY